MNSRRLFRVAMLRALVLTGVTFGAGVLLYGLMGVSVVSGALFALACGIGAVLAAAIN